jgi:hypothetical protein
VHACEELKAHNKDQAFQDAIVVLLNDSELALKPMKMRSALSIDFEQKRWAPVKQLKGDVSSLLIALGYERLPDKKNKYGFAGNKDDPSVLKRIKVN